MFLYPLKRNAFSSFYYLFRFLNAKTVNFVHKFLVFSCYSQPMTPLE